ncbi:hypothetical protein NUU61_004363 [Penicillium alfredii]|uniref:Peptidase S8/S53 domain-containing protein n=1 Tax=Penicillium alfredii TaxID=1506179 RepID=A0A9W9FKZ4_9EURO|nr:uncharacterized protein NUU61_004363 [Penicillium alfredii]KAJ5102141.1 hypothetical protein NUU61_004363 [Penicillium alfredii]
MEGIQASFSRVTGESPWGDESYPWSESHSTCVITKAAGTTYGAAKEVSVVPVKIGYLSQETLAEGMDEALGAIIENQLHGRAIVLITMASRYPLYPDNPRPDVQEVRRLADELFGQGVPIVLAAGNSARRGSSQRQNIDTMPPTLARVLPVINVGNVEWSGDFYHTSQRGPLLSISAMGTDITCLDKNGRLKYDTGTSYSAPLVAAHIAILISTHDPDLPFNERGISGEEYVRRIKRYVEDKANSVRVPGGPKVLWNMATARDHRLAPAVC